MSDIEDHYDPSCASNPSGASLPGDDKFLAVDGERKDQHAYALDNQYPPNPRDFALNLLDEEVLTADTVARTCLRHMSWADIRDALEEIGVESDADLFDEQK